MDEYTIKTVVAYAVVVGVIVVAGYVLAMIIDAYQKLDEMYHSQMMTHSMISCMHNIMHDKEEEEADGGEGTEDNTRNGDVG